MYYKHFGLHQPPFKITPDTRLFFPGANRGAVLEALVYAVTNGEGIVKVVGEVGSGKTMLCRMLEVELPKNVDIVYIANPSLSPEHILHAIALELRLPVTSADNRLRVMQALQEYLLNKHADNRRVVIFVEEAQSMPVATLEEIRLLSNLETGQDKLLQIVLFGQPELDRTLAGHDIRQLKERITYSFCLPPFKNDEIRDYLLSRLRASGHRAGEVFMPRALRAIARYSKGLVRRINIIADKAMLAAYAANATAITPKHVEAAARDSEFVPEPRIPAWVMAAGMVLLLAGAGAAAWWYSHSAPPGVAVAAVASPEGGASGQPQTPPPAGTPAIASVEPPAVSPAIQTGPTTQPERVVQAEPASVSVAAAAPVISEHAPAGAAVPAAAPSPPGIPTPVDTRVGGGSIPDPMTVSAAPPPTAAVVAPDALTAELLTTTAEEPLTTPLLDIRNLSDASTSSYR